MNKAGKTLKLTYTDIEGNQHVVSSVGCDPEDAELELQMEAQSEGWDDIEQYLGETHTFTVDFSNISWDETWLVAYQARMYANCFKN